MGEVEHPEFILQMRKMALIILYFLGAIWLLSRVRRLQVAFPAEVSEQMSAAQKWCFQDAAIAQWSQQQDWAKE